MNMSPIIFLLISLTVSFQGQSAAHPIPGYVKSPLEECLDLCQSNSCQTDRNVREGCNQMFSCAHGCKLRQLGVEKGVCQDLCDRNGQSGCSPNVSGWKFDLCRKCNRGGYSCTKWPQVGECEQGCNFYKRDCSCTDYINKKGYGDCQKGHPDFSNAEICYAKLPSTCSDLRESETDPGKMASAEACKKGHLPPGEWDLIFRQVYPGHLFSSGEWQTGDKTQPTFSNLQELEKYRRADGSFHFYLWYPELGEGNEWIQSSNPMMKTGGGVEGYQAVDISFQTQFWGGLEYSGVHSLLDGSVNHGHWYYAIGSFHEWGGAIPGPNGPVKKVELYIESTKGSLKLDNEVPYMLVGSAWMPICGHFFWDNNIGADIVCQSLGFQGGVLQKERRPYSEDAYYVGRCDSRSITDLVNGCTKEILAAQYSCKKGRPVSIKVKCKVL